MARLVPIAKRRRQKKPGRLEIDHGAPLHVLMERLSILLHGAREPLSPEELEVYFRSSDRTQLVIAALVAGGFVDEDEEGRVRGRKIYVRRRLPVPFRF